MFIILASLTTVVSVESIGSIKRHSLKLLNVYLLSNNLCSAVENFTYY